MANSKLLERIAEEVENLIMQNPTAVEKFKKNIKVFKQHVQKYLKAQKNKPDPQTPNPVKWEIKDKLSCYYATLAVIYDSVKAKTPVAFSDNHWQKSSLSTSLDNYISGMLFHYATSDKSPYGNTGLDTAIKWVKADLASIEPTETDFGQGKIGFLQEELTPEEPTE